MEQGGSIRADREVGDAGVLRPDPIPVSDLDPAQRERRDRRTGRAPPHALEPPCERRRLVFILIHSVLWPVALNTHSGFRAVSQTLRMVGRNYGLKGFAYIRKILIPAAFPSILTGLKIGWAFAWRTLVAAELVFGVSSGQGG